MANRIAGTPAPATTAGNRPTTGTPTSRLSPNKRRPQPALPDPITAQDVLERIGEIGVHWWSVIDSVLETHQCRDRIHPHPVAPLPEWAVERLKDQGRHNAAEHEFSEKRHLLKDWLHLAEVGGSQYRYEAWTSHGHRLEFRHLSWADAATVVDRMKVDFPDAFVARVHVHSHQSMVDDPALLNTLIGAIQHVGTFMPESTEDEYTVRDETGRNVTVTASQLRAHPVYERLSKKGKESLNHYLDECKPRKERIRAAAKEGKL
ncbi:hypothetical protein [Acidovorax sp. NCPPB 3576]|uniref:hypothetical protein n=1 Tax=Acidovorax sp. NCPPB 3576 TaxID=2940488 RepID=UPI00234AD85F|nr:hypothetical protein [Acidovorax sp. NCPPB 3576]WCM88810.1 hypothetical protein M5C98_01785 [Acidovorax sp. NCPPB 3576]